MDNIVICTMSVSDLEEIEPIFNTSFDDFWNINILKSELSNPLSEYVVAKFDNKIIGFAGVTDGLDQMHISNIVVHKDFRNLSIGSKLLNELISITKSKNRDALTLEVNENNLIAQKLYNKFGFKILGKRKKYYNGVDDAVIMTLYLAN